MTVHRALDGAWAECANADCDLLFHFPGMTVTELQRIPLNLLLPLFEAVEPPHELHEGWKMWSRAQVQGGIRLWHRDYDLPALIGPRGDMEWYRGGIRHRADGKPALIGRGRHREWWVDGEQHRDGDEPAIIYENGFEEYWARGKQYSPAEASADTD